MVKKWIIIYSLLTLVGVANAQHKMKVELGVWTNYRLAAMYAGIDPGVNGAGIAVGLNQPINDRLNANVSGELGAAGTGFYAACNAGIEIEIPFPSSRLYYKPGINLLQGAGLFRPELIYMWGIEQRNILAIRLKNGSLPGLLLGIRYYGFPGYAVFSEINHFLDLRVGMNYRF